MFSKSHLTSWYTWKTSFSYMFCYNMYFMVVILEFDFLDESSLDILDSDLALFIVNFSNDICRITWSIRILLEKHIKLRSSLIHTAPSLNMWSLLSMNRLNRFLKKFPNTQILPIPHALNMMIIWFQFCLKIVMNVSGPLMIFVLWKWSRKMML